MCVIILKKSFEFALSIIDYCEKLEVERKFVISNQLLKSGTSIGANVHEAQFAESKVDFIHKLKIAEKETNETEYWLQLCKSSKSYLFDEELLNKVIEIKKIISKIIISTKTRLNN